MSSASSPGSWGVRPSKKAQTPPETAALDAFVGGTKVKGATKRLNADIPVSLHARVKAGCALEGRDITDMLIELLEQRFPAHKEILK